jgi:hypothetical protein
MNEHDIVIEYEQVDQEQSKLNNECQEITNKARA